VANRKRIPPEPPRPVIRGGATRPSLRVSLKGQRKVARRRLLNSRLLAATCAFGPAPVGPLTASDLELLRRVSSERFSSEQLLLRMQAIRELARAESLTGVDHLVALATSPVEGEQVRAASLAALMSASPRIAQAVVAGLGRDTPRLVQQTAARIDEGSDKAPAGRAGARGRKRRRKPRSPTLDAARNRR
jgi:hypothetical protein